MLAFQSGLRTVLHPFTVCRTVGCGPLWGLNYPPTHKTHEQFFHNRLLINRGFNQLLSLYVIITRKKEIWREWWMKELGTWLYGRHGRVRNIPYSVVWMYCTCGVSTRYVITCTVGRSEAGEGTSANGRMYNDIIETNYMYLCTTP